MTFLEFLSKMLDNLSVIILTALPIVSLVLAVAYMTFRFEEIVDWPVENQVLCAVLLGIDGIIAHAVCIAVHNHFLAVPENWVWVQAHIFGSCTGWIGFFFARSLEAIWTGVDGILEHVFMTVYSGLMLIGGLAAFIVTGSLLPVFVIAACLYALMGVVYGIAWFCKEPAHIFTPLDPSHKLRFFEATGKPPPPPPAKEDDEEVYVFRRVKREKGPAEGVRTRSTQRRSTEGARFEGRD